MRQRLIQSDIPPAAANRIPVSTGQPLCLPGNPETLRAALAAQPHYQRTQRQQPYRRRLRNRRNIEGGSEIIGAGERHGVNAFGEDTCGTIMAPIARIRAFRPCVFP